MFGTGQQPDRAAVIALVGRREIAVIGHERLRRLFPQRLLDHRMPPGNDLEGEAVIHFRTEYPCSWASSASAAVTSMTDSASPPP
jgi:hypothetical protein